MRDLSVVANPQPKEPVIVVDFQFDSARLRMPEGVPQGLGSNPVDFVAKDRMERPRLSFYLNIKVAGASVGFIGH